ncbi:MAG TPA: SDR family NAD(P)-dependent oxidoreductase, partial [Clostridia bacterium]|nr:SDR family NAD(P)-dependent oxidoreductase [Clostridia bacterium]
PIEKDYYKIGIESSDYMTRTFDDNSDGSGIGEGAGVIILKSLKKALKDRDNIYAVIKGSAVNQNGSSIVLTAPNPAAQTEIIVKAWKNSGVDPQTISYIEAHGTGTKIGDPIEIEALKAAFERYTLQKQFCAIGSVKSNLGHLYDCAGIAGLIKVVYALKNKLIPPTVLFNTPNKNIDFCDTPFYVNSISREWIEGKSPRRCGISSFGISGTNCHMVLEQVPEIQIPEEVTGDECLNILALSAKTENALQNLISSYKAYLENTPCPKTSDICYTANTGRGHYDYRIALVVRNFDDLKGQIEYLHNNGWSCIDKSSGYSDKIFVYGNSEDIVEVASIADVLADKKLDDFIASGKENSALLRELCRLYVQGADIKWERLYKDGCFNKISLPVYPFERLRCWFELPDSISQDNEIGQSEQFFKMGWKEEELKLKSIKLQQGVTLVIKDGSGADNELQEALVRLMKEAGRNLIEVELGEEFNKYEINKYQIRNVQADYERLISENKFNNITQVIHLTTLGMNKGITDIKELNSSQDIGVISLLFLIKAMVKYNLTDNINVVIMSDYVNEVTGKEKQLTPEKATLFGLGRVVRSEITNMDCRCIDIDDATPMEQVAKEFNGNGDIYYTAYRNGKRYVEEFKELQLDKLKYRDIQIKEGGVYIITGGIGGIGMEMAKYLARKNKVHIVLVSRSGITDLGQYEDNLSEKDSKFSKRLLQQRQISEIQRLGSEVVCLNADVSEFESVKFVLDTVRERYGVINGVINAAGIGGAELIAYKEESDFKSVLAPKVQGTWIMDYLTQSDSLDFFIMISSAASLFGTPGEGDYTAANSYLDAFSAYRNRTSKNTLTINYPPWKETGMAVDHGFTINALFKSILTDEAIAGFGEVLNKDISKVFVGSINYDENINRRIENFPVRLSDGIKLKLDRAKSFGGIRINSKKKGLQPIGDAIVRLYGRNDNNYTDTERKLASIYSSVLGVHDININDNFFEMGGDSFKGASLVAIIRREFKVAISIREMLDYPTLKTLAENIENKEEDVFSNIARVEEKDYYLASPSQKRMYALKEIEGEGIAYNNPEVFILEGNLNIKLVEEVFTGLIKRHEALRTSFEVLEGEVVQKIHKSVDFKLQIIETPQHNNLYTTQNENINNIVKEFIRPFDLKQAPLIRVGLCDMGKNRFLLLLDTHHIISDGVSMGLLLKEFSELYRGKKLPDCRIQYKDYAELQNRALKSNNFSKMERYWEHVFSGDIPILNNQTDFSRPRVQTFNGDSLRLDLDAELSLSLDKFTRRTGTTMYMVLLAAYNILLAKYTGQEDIVVGSPSAGRTSPELMGIFGLFVNTLAMRNYPESNKTIKEFISEVKENCLKAYENQEYPLDELISKLGISRDIDRNPLFDTMFVMENIDYMGVHIEGLKLTRYNASYGVSKLDFSLYAYEKEQGLYFIMEYNTALYKRETIHRMLAHYRNILEYILRQPEEKLLAVDMISNEEENTLLHTFNNTQAQYPKDNTIHGIFEEQVERTPEAVAGVFEGNEITYRQLNEKSNAIAAELRRIGMKPGSIAGIIVERSLEMIIGIMGILKAGGAYMPISPAYPEARIKYMLEDSKACVLVTQEDLDGKFAFDIETINLNNKELYKGDCNNPVNTSGPSDLSYVIYTSGSTGNPKGVMIEHYSVINRLNWMQKKYPIGTEDVILQKTPFTFDVSVWELFWWAFRGARVCFLKPGGEKDPEVIVEAIENSKVTTMHFVPSMLSAFMEYMEEHGGIDRLSSLKKVFASGEALSAQQVKRFNRLFCKSNGTELYNLYGPTEATVDVSYFDCSAGDEPEVIPIGKPIDNINLYILDKNNRL